MGSSFGLLEEESTDGEKACLGMRVRPAPEQPPSYNKRVSGCGRLRRPPTQPAEYRWSRGREVIERRKQYLETK